MDWFWTWLYPIVPATLLIIVSAEYRAWRDRSNRRAAMERLDRIAAALEREL